MSTEILVLLLILLGLLLQPRRPRLALVGVCP